VLDVFILGREPPFPLQHPQIQLLHSLIPLVELRGRLPSPVLVHNLLILHNLLLHVDHVFVAGLVPKLDMHLPLQLGQDLLALLLDLVQQVLVALRRLLIQEINDLVVLPDKFLHDIAFEDHHLLLLLLLGLLLLLTLFLLPINLLSFFLHLLLRLLLGSDEIFQELLFLSGDLVPVLHLLRDKHDLLSLVQLLLSLHTLQVLSSGQPLGLFEDAFLGGLLLFLLLVTGFGSFSFAIYALDCMVRPPQGRDEVFIFLLLPLLVDEEGVLEVFALIHRIVAD